MKKLEASYLSLVGGCPHCGGGILHVGIMDSDRNDEGCDNCHCKIITRMVIWH